MLSILWGDWLPNNMEFLNGGKESFRLGGKCPYPKCGLESVFLSVTKPYVQKEHSLRETLTAACECSGCGRCILVIIAVRPGNSLYCTEHYPLETTDDSLPEEIPEEVSGDFKEALRCHWIKSFKATVLMCRRALQASCDKEQAAGKDLYSQIADLADKQRITGTLKEMAHRIRLPGKKGAHGDYSDINDNITEKDAKDAITFMRHYLDHVYVLPKQLEEDAS